jgi:hypothetical protein
MIVAWLANGDRLAVILPVIMSPYAEYGHMDWLWLSIIHRHTNARSNRFSIELKFIVLDLAISIVDYWLLRYNFKF